MDAKRTTYAALKIIMENQVAEHFNLDGRRGEKIAFSKYKIYSLVTGL